MFRRPSDVRYTRFLKALHQGITPDWYLEIGTRFGWSAQRTNGKVILVDPFFRISEDIIGDSPAVLAFQQTSDDFFASGVIKSLGVQIGLSFLDGMHLIEYLLRDFMNTESVSHPKGAIMMHDCCPFSFTMTTRDLDNLPKGAWTGDVWKIIPMLQHHRPDLDITVLGCKPTGIVIVRGLDPNNRVLKENYNDIVAEWREVTLEDYGVEKFYASFKYSSARAYMNDGFSFIHSDVKADSAQKPVYVTP